MRDSLLLAGILAVRARFAIRIYMNREFLGGKFA